MEPTAEGTPKATTRSRTLTLLLTGALLVGALAVGAQYGVRAEEGSEPVAGELGPIDKEAARQLFGKPGYSPYVGRDYPRRPLFGDTHLHTMQGS